jgi:hypothetical protein
MQPHPSATQCTLRDEGLYLTFNDGKSFFYPQTFLYATRFTHAQVLPSDPVSTKMTAVPGSSLQPPIKG